MTLEDLDKKTLKKLFENNSCGEIARSCGTYPNKIRRLAQSLGLKVPNHSEAQEALLRTGKVKHPTEGKERTEEEKEKISKSVYENYENMTDEEKEKISERHKELWKKVPEAQKRRMLENSMKAVRKTANDGSKTEKFLRTALEQKGYYLEFHKKNLVANEKLEIDLFFPTLHTILEINGPSHYLDIRGIDALRKQQASDAQKYGLLLSLGYCVVIVRHLKDASDEYHRRLLDVVETTLSKIKNKFPKAGERMIEVEV